MSPEYGAEAQIGLPAQRWRRRLASLGRVYPAPVPDEPVTVDPTLLTPEERWELDRIMRIVERAGLVGRPEWELSFIACCRRKLEQRSTEHCPCEEP
jgi:hypothetical protein